MKKSFLFFVVATGLVSGFTPNLMAFEARLIDGRSPVEEPYKPLHGGSFSGEKVPLSPDPLVDYRWKETKVTDELQTYLLAPVKVTTDEPESFGNLESATEADCDVEVKGTGSIRFDFGVESAAWLEFDSPDLVGEVEMSISECNEPAILNIGPEHPAKTLKPVKHGNTYRLELNKSLYEGVRFGWIHVRTFDKPWRITAVRLVCQTKPVNYEGSFACSDPMLTRIWYVGAYGVKLNMLKNELGAILMERSDRFSWTGDDYAAQSAILAAFGEYPYMKANLERTARQNNGIESYSLYWILSVMNYYRYSGDAEGLREFAANAEAKLDHANEIYANPKVIFYGWDERLGAGFGEPVTLDEPKDAYRMLFIRTCREFAAAMKSIGENQVADKFEKIAGERVAELRADPEWVERFGLHAAADAVNADFTTPSQQARLFDREFSDRATRISFSPFNQYFVIQAMARMNRYDEALASIRDHWGGQIEYGGTTFFENFWPAWKDVLGPNDTLPNCQSGTTSLCHPWGSGVTQWLTEEVLGVKPTRPGFKTYDIFPHLGRTLTWVSGSVPTPEGTIRAEFDVSKGLASVQAPAGTTGRIGVPKAERTIESITINGKLAWDGAFRAVPGIGGAEANPDFVTFSDVRPGTYEMKVVYSGTAPTFADGPWIYPAKFVKEDRETGGDWGGKYGADGYVLFGADGEDKDLVQLPDYVESVTRRLGRVGQFSEPGDSQALAKGPEYGSERSKGVFYSGNPHALEQCVVLDVALKQPTDYEFALYFADIDRKNRRQSLELFDMDTRKLIAPTRIYTDFEGGTYAVYKCDRSVRLRVNHIRGDNAVLNGIFFDPPVQSPSVTVR